MPQRTLHPVNSLVEHITTNLHKRLEIIRNPPTANELAKRMYTQFERYLTSSVVLHVSDVDAGTIL
jgi:hypothetical protein